MMSPKSIALVTDEGEEFSIKIGCYTTVLDMKQKIKEKRGIRMIDQSLCFKGEILPDDFNVYSATHIDAPIFLNVDRPAQDTITLSSPTLFEITLQTPLRVKVHGMDTVAQLKTQIPLKIESMATTPSTLILLKHQGMELEDSSKTLLQCGIAADSVVTVEVSKKLNLLVKMPVPDDSKFISVQMCATDKVWQFKEKIKEFQSLTAAGILAIFMGEKELADHRMLADCAIPPNELLTLQFHPTNQKRQKKLIASENA